MPEILEHISKKTTADTVREVGLIGCRAFKLRRSKKRISKRLKILLRSIVKASIKSKQSSTRLNLLLRIR